MNHAENRMGETYIDPYDYQRDYSDIWKKYDWVKIGSRIRDERFKLNMSQRELIARMRNRDAGMGRAILLDLEKGEYGKDERFTTGILSDLENGVPVKGLAIRQLTAMCDIFNCDIGYLLCEYDEKTWGKHNIAEYTGLSEQAIDTIHTLQQNGDRFIRILPFINQLLSDPKTIEKLSTRLNTIAAITDMAKGALSERDEMNRDGAVFSLSRIIAEQAEKIVNNPAQPKRRTMNP